MSTFDLELMRRLLDAGLSAGEAVRVAHRARAAIDVTIENLELAAARLVEEQAVEIELVAAFYRDAADRLRGAA